MAKWKSGLNSMAWRIQSLYALILVVVVSGLMVAIYHFEQQRQLTKLDADTAAMVQHLLPDLAPERRAGRAGPLGARTEGRPGGRGAGRPMPPGGRPGPRRQAAEPVGEIPEPEAVAAERRQADNKRQRGIKENDKVIENGGFLVVWNAREEETTRKGNPPPEVTYRVGTARPTYASINDHRVIWKMGPGRITIAAGIPLSPLHEHMAGFAWNLVIFATAIVSTVMLVGIFVVHRGLRPIADIGKTAEEISHGDLSRRIDGADNSSELGTLSEVLNECFGRLEENFSQQQRFTADASHELRTPVAVLLSTSQRMLAHERSEAEYRDAFKLCERSALRMKRLVDELTELARFDSGEVRLDLEEVSLDVVAGSVLHDLEPIFKEHKATLTVDLKPCSCAIDTARIEQVVTNLVMNAMRHNDPGVQITARTWEEGGHAWLEISDDGKGIPPEMLKRIFERFSQLDAVRNRGSGLGLAICKVIVEGHDGSIDVESKPDQGCSFRVGIPSVDVND